MPAGAPPALILAASDGYANAFRNDDGFRQVARDLWTMLRDEGEAAVSPHLRGWLDEASQQGRRRRHQRRHPVTGT